ncbi:hypothetical protein H4582DRAFT_1100502 [Lactarius indigo]|nr:hypothetical protein H4582DRAFT_1100502 [Lactarius indigo]
MIPSTLEPSVSTPPPPILFSSSSPSGAASFQNIPDCYTTLDVLDVPLLLSPAPVLESILPMGCYSSLLAPAAPGPSRLWLVIASDPVAATEGEGSMEAALHKESDSLGPPLAIQENIIVTSDLPSQPPPSPSVTDVAIAGPSRSSLGEEQTGDRPPYPLHSQYDIVQTRKFLMYDSILHIFTRHG